MTDQDQKISSLQEMRKNALKKKKNISPSKKKPEDSSSSSLGFNMLLSSQNQQKSSSDHSKSQKMPSQQQQKMRQKNNKIAHESKQSKQQSKQQIIKYSIKQPIQENKQTNRKNKASQNIASLNPIPEQKVFQQTKLNQGIQNKQKLTPKINTQLPFGKTLQNVSQTPNIEILPLNIQHPPLNKPINTNQFINAQLKPPTMPILTPINNGQVSSIITNPNLALSVDQTIQKDKNNQVKTIKVMLKQAESIKIAVMNLQSSVQGLDYIKKKIEYDKKFRDKIKGKMQYLREIFGVE